MIRKALRALWAIVRGKRYVSKVLMVGVSVWWDEDGKSIRSFQKLTKSTAIGAISGQSAKIYLISKVSMTAHNAPYDLTVIHLADVKLHTIMMRFEIEGWVNEVEKNPFV